MDFQKLWKESGFLGADKFYTWLKTNRHPNVTHKQIQSFLEDQAGWQLTKQQNLPRQYSSWWVRYPAQQYQIDLMVYDRYTIDKYKYVLCMVDIYSRYANARALTNKMMSNLIEKLEEMMKENEEIMAHGGDGVPEQISADNEFNTNTFKDAMRELGVQEFFFSDPYELHHNPIVERFHRTLARRMQRYRQQTRDRYWPAFLKDVILAYNKSTHRTTHATPYDIFTGKHRNYQLYKEVGKVFHVGDFVRYRLDKPILRKGDRLLWSSKIYIIERIVGSRYMLMDPDNQSVLRRRYRDYELIPAARVEYNIADDDLEEEGDEFPLPPIPPQQRRQQLAEAAERRRDAEALAPRRSTREIRPTERYPEHAAHR